MVVTGLGRQFKDFKDFPSIFSRPIPTIFYHVTLDISGCTSLWNAEAIVWPFKTMNACIGWKTFVTTKSLKICYLFNINHIHGYSAWCWQMALASVLALMPKMDILSTCCNKDDVMWCVYTFEKQWSPDTFVSIQLMTLTSSSLPLPASCRRATATRPTSAGQENIRLHTKPPYTLTPITLLLTKKRDFSGTVQDYQNVFLLLTVHTQCNPIFAQISF